MTYPPQGPRIRQDIRDLGTDADPWHPIVLAYAQAVRIMQSRPLDDPTSWEHQAAMHGRAGRPLPGALWNQCQHATWYFLPWHRMYLYHLEAMVARAMGTRGGPDGWALPYWDYSVDSNAARLPAAFRERTLPNGSANPLFVEQRNPRRNAGVPLPPQATDTTRALAPTIFTNPPPPGPAAFGGPRTGFAHQGPAFGTLEATPHGAVHVQVGGWMSDPDTAALDPIFWLHHANIDRLWEVWLRQGDRQNPDAAQWLSQRFDLHNAEGQRVTMAVEEVLDSTQLGYTYANLPTPPAVAVAKPREAMGISAMSDQPPPQLVGATERPVVLTGSPASTELRLSAPTGPMAEDFAAGRPRRAYMHVENISGDRNPGTSYGVYVNLPNEDLPAEERDAYLVGVVSFFGIKQANEPDPGDKEQHGLHYAFDVTDVLNRFGPRDAGEGGELRVTFLPLEPPGGEEASGTQPQVSIGTVSLFYGE